MSYAAIMANSMLRFFFNAVALLHGLGGSVA